MLIEMQDPLFLAPEPGERTANKRSGIQREHYKS